MAEVEAALFDDLNAPERAGGAVHVHPRGRTPSSTGAASDVESLERARAAFARINGVLDIVPDRAVDDPELAAWVEERIAARRAARERRDFAEADRIRAELTERGDRDRGRAGGGTTLEAGSR